ncbi:MAG: hypothetical protein FWC89_10425 [Defluviitaleaceae bacterium]|nr:hypothetical protein [Defluviitaleaceae bacterium]
MAALEIQIEQKKRLFMLLKIKKSNEGYEVKALDDLILATEAEMQQEDVAWVEKKIDKL